MSHTPLGGRRSLALEQQSSLIECKKMSCTQNLLKMYSPSRAVCPTVEFSESDSSLARTVSNREGIAGVKPCAGIAGRAQMMSLVIEVVT